MPAELEIVPADLSYPELHRDYCRTLTAPMDDMYAAFAELADRFTLRLEGEPVGFFSVDDARELRCFYVRPAEEQRASEFFRQVLTSRSICAAWPATLDPAFASLSLDLARGVEVKALLFQHLADPEPVRAPLATMRRAVQADFEASVAFQRAATGAPLAFLRPYVSARIEAGELRLHEVEGAIVGAGELRRDGASPGFAHLGVMVGAALRGQGLGSAIMRYLVHEAERERLAPICSTEPTNLAARRAIERAGFRARHRVLRVALPQGPSASPEG